MSKAMRLFLRGAAVAMLAFSLLGVPSALAHPGDGGQHGPLEGHLLGDGEWGKIELVGQLTVSDAEEGLIADVAVDPDEDYAYLARWGAPSALVLKAMALMAASMSSTSPTSAIR